MGPCDECGFDFGTARREEVGRRVTAAAQAIAARLTGRAFPVDAATVGGSVVSDRVRSPRPRRAADDPRSAGYRTGRAGPGFKPLYREERIDLGLYRADTPPEIVAELEAAASMFVRLFDAIDPELLSRPVRYGFPEPTPRTLLWMGLQAIHETEHHLGDIEANLQR